MTAEIRKEQQDAIDFALNNNRCGLLLSTAFGKTYVAHGLASSFKNRTVIITVSNALVKQFISAFDIPFLIGKKHYRKKDYEEIKHRVENSNIVITNPAAFHTHKDTIFQGFDNIIIDEADACLGLFKLQVCTSYGTHQKEMCVKDIYELLFHIDEYKADKFIQTQQYKFWRIEETMESDKKKNKEPYTLRIHDVNFNGEAYFKPYQRVVLMSGTLFKSDVKELLGEGVPIYEAPSPIPIERRSIYGFTDIGESYSPDDPKELAEIISNALKTHEERPVVIHTTYALAPQIAQYIDSVKFFTEKDEKIEALLAIEGTDDALLAAGAQIGLDLKDDKCRLNILLNGFFPNLGDMYVMKRKSLPFGNEWYQEQVLRLVIQACGRSTRSVDDYSKILICDNRLIKLIIAKKDELPKYFLESCKFLA